MAMIRELHQATSRRAALAAEAVDRRAFLARQGRTVLHAWANVIRDLAAEATMYAHVAAPYRAPARHRLITNAAGCGPGASLSRGDGAPMANCCGSSRCTCRVIAGPGITVDGNGSPGAPYVIGGGGGGTTVVEAGTGVTVTGTGTAADPYEVSAVPPETGCGLTGAGSPLAAVVAAWPYPCDADTSAGGVYCDSAGQLRSEPRGMVTIQQDQQTLNVADVAVPVLQDTEVATHQHTVTNPDACRPAFVITEVEADVGAVTLVDRVG
ncbi:hypothetical protein SBD_1847 [Streptomyces bottropensis ATCC 25435]|uniref:Uncharacterized protein n=2 Tax=Streptomyces TaxID=1883 RepID=M3FX19_9ACTN|nr:hypothetical protein SBD_1847 [Streptomyces bottropensis ATCC 25435]